MKSRFFLFPFSFFLLLSGASVAQELRTGNYPDGTLRYKGYFKDNRPCGEMTHFYPDGRVKARMDNRGDTADVILYNRDGDFTSVGRFIDRKKTGVWEYRKNDRVVASEAYAGNVREGVAVRYFASGKPAEEKGWNAGTPDGPWILYYEDGKMRMKSAYVAGKLTGMMKSYDRGGAVRAEGVYKNDLKEGEWHFYDSEGRLQKKLHYRNGIPENAEEVELEESRRLDALISSAKKIPDPAVFADDPEMYMQLTGESFPRE